MTSPVNSISADFTIAAAINQPFTPAGDNLIEVAGPSDPTLFGRDVQRVTIAHSFNQPFGRFCIDVAPREVLRGQTWAQIIKPYSRCAIALRRWSGDRDDPASTETPVPVMVGLVDSPEIQEDFSHAGPQRECRLVGRGIASVLADHRWWFHSLLSAVALGSDAPALPHLRDFMLGPPPAPALLEQEVEIRTRGLLAINPDLFALSERTPARLMATAFKFFVEGTGRNDPFIKVNFVDGVPLSELLQLDQELAGASYFDPAARMISQHLPTTSLPNASCWDIMRLFNPDHYQELFAEVRGATLAEARMHIVARKPPFAGAIGDPNGAANVVFGTGQAPALRGESLFEEQYPGWDRYAETVYIDDGDVIAIPTMRRSVEGVGRVFTLYQVTPALIPFTGDQGQETWKQFILPIIDEDPESPSYIHRYGVRPFEVHSKTIPAVDEQSDEKLPRSDIARRCYAYAALAREWFYRAPEMWEGNIVLKGRTDVRLGKRLVLRSHRLPGIVREFYITGVSHSMQFSKDPLFTTTLQVARGWDLHEGAL